MCSPTIIAKVQESAAISRRALLARTTAAGVVTAAGLAGLSQRSARAQDASPTAVEPRLTAGFSNIIDLSHVWGPDFPMFPGAQQPQFDVLVTIEANGFFKYQLTLDEHTGTHMDAPLHFAVDGIGAESIAVDQLVAPLAVVDISSRATSDPDTQGSVDDLLAWEAANGPLPAGAFVALNSGWESRVSDPVAFLNVDDASVPHFPGWHPDAAAFLVSERDVVGFGVDTISLDFGASTDFGAHLTMLSAGKYGLENLAMLGSVPAVGATIVVGGPRHLGGSGGPTRVLAFM